MRAPENPPAPNLLAKAVSVSLRLDEFGLGVVMAVLIAGAIISSHQGFPTVSAAFVCLQIQWAIVTTLRILIMADERSAARKGPQP